MEPAILYVDDERANLDLFSRSFDEEFRVMTAASGVIALEILEAEKGVGVLVSDQRMDPMTGIDLLTRAAARWPDVTRVLLTAYSDRELLLQAIQLGKVHDYVLKPWSREDLAALMYYVRPHPFDAMIWNPGGGARNQFEMDTDMNRYVGRDFLFITQSEIEPWIAARFAGVSPPVHVTIPLGSGVVRRYFAYELVGFKGYR